MAAFTLPFRKALPPSLNQLRMATDMTRGGWGVDKEEVASVTIPTSMISIGHNAFGGCISLRSVGIPASVTRIKTGAFNECPEI